MQELETLLKSLVHRGRKPCGEEIFDLNIEDGVISMFPEDFFSDSIKLNLRSIVSLESGLWQFVCSQKLFSDKVDMKDYIENSYWFQDKPYDKDGFYWVMRCARLEEEELGKFLVDNIKVEWKKE